MALLNRFIPWITSLLALVLVERIFLAPRTTYWLASYLIIAVILSIWQLTGRRFRSVKFWRFLATPFFFTVAGLLFLVFLRGPIARQVFLVAYAVCIWLYLEIIFLRFNFRPKYQIHALENIFTHLELVTVFLAACSFFSIVIFLGVKLWIVTAMFAALILLFSYQVVWTSDTDIIVAWPYAAVIVIVMVEIFFVAGYLPTNVYVNGAVVGISYYLVTGLIRNWLLGNKEWRVVRRYVIVASAIIIATLATARWF